MVCQFSTVASFLPACLLTCLPSPFFPAGLSLAADQSWFYLEQRATLCHEFLQAMMGKHDPTRPFFGVLLSGPNGTGKSAIGMETALTCFARGMVSIYISTASEWVEAARKGNGDGFLLECLLRQNADLIAAQPALRKALAPALVVEPDAVGAFDAHASNGIIKVLCSALTANRSVKVGLIVDEVQNITAAISSGKLELASTAPRVGADYFQQWFNWDNRNRVFVRMDIASSHGLRDLRLPSGEQHRLRIIMPWSTDVITAATTAMRSPFAFSKDHESARQRIVHYAGGIPRSLLQGKRILDEALAAGKDLEVATSNAENAIMQEMRLTCARWFSDLGSPERQKEAAKLILRLVRGEVEWDAVKGLYDSGIVARYDSDQFNVKSVSNAAASVVMSQLATYYRKGEFTPLHQVAVGAPRGYELETQVLILLADGANTRLPTVNVMGDDSESTVPVDVAMPISFGEASELVAHPSNARLYVPTSSQFACDAITVPPTSANDSASIVLWETSVTSPYDSARVAKIRKWFRTVGTLSDKKNKVLPAGIVTLLQKAHPTRSIVCALCFPENLMGTTGSKLAYKELLQDAVAASSEDSKVRVAVVDITGLQKLGVLP